MPPAQKEVERLDAIADEAEKAFADIDKPDGWSDFVWLVSTILIVSLLITTYVMHYRKDYCFADEEKKSGEEEAGEGDGDSATKKEKKEEVVNPTIQSEGG